MSQQQNPIERAVDIFVFAPIGVAMFAKDTVPTFMKMFVSRGQTELQHRKKSLSDQANQYRAVGRFAVKYGGPEVKRQAEGKIDGARRFAEETFSGLVVARSGSGDAPKVDEPKVDPPKATPAPVVPSATAPAKTKKVKSISTPAAANGSKVGKATNGTATTSTAAPRDADVDAAANAASTLAIPGYDQLSASQVVERLDGLTPGELDAVRAYELAHRGRNTILGKITQLAT